MNTRKLYKSAYRIYRGGDSDQIIGFVSMACAFGLVDETANDVVCAAATSYYNRDTSDRYKSWMYQTRCQVNARRIVAPIGKAFLDAFIAIANAKGNTP